MPRLIHVDTGDIAVARVQVARSIGWTAMRGLLGRPSPGVGEGLLLADPLRCVHTFGMRYPIDVVFLDRRLHVVGLARRVPPLRIAWHARGCRQLELAAGAAAIAGLVPGRQLRLIAEDGGRDRPESPQAVRDIGNAEHESHAGPCATTTGPLSITPAAAPADGGNPSDQGVPPCARTF